VRLAYLNEAGILKTADEPYAVVAGIILRGDVALGRGAFQGTCAKIST
jgi:hypothetical protein